jgi:hypothetical protein
VFGWNDARHGRTCSGHPRLWRAPAFYDDQTNNETPVVLRPAIGYDL